MLDLRTRVRAYLNGEMGSDNEDDLIHELATRADALERGLRSVLRHLGEDHACNESRRGTHATIAPARALLVNTQNAQEGRQ